MIGAPGRNGCLTRHEQRRGNGKGDAESCEPAVDALVAEGMAEDHQRPVDRQEGQHLKPDSQGERRHAPRQGTQKCRSPRHQRKVEDRRGAKDLHVVMVDAAGDELPAKLAPGQEDNKGSDCPGRTHQAVRAVADHQNSKATQERRPQDDRRKLGLGRGQHPGRRHQKGSDTEIDVARPMD
jgi:hypothetical protein